MIDEKSFISRKNDESAGVTTKTSSEGDNGFCYPKICLDTEIGTEPSTCWCCSTNKSCTGTRQDCESICKK